MAKIITGIVIGVAGVFSAGFIFLVSGGMPVATKGGPLPLERWIARTSIHAAIGTARSLSSPLQASEASLVAGAKLYVNDCAGCHGLPGHPSGMARAMYPHPPQFFVAGHGVTDDPIGVIDWKVKNGIRLTGMPAFVDLMKDDEIWQVSLFLQGADHLPEAAKRVLQSSAR